MNKLVHQRTILSAAVILALGVNGAASADESDTVLEEIVVVAHPLADGGLAQASALLTGDDLDEARAGTIGETLSTLPGITSASFGAAVGRPVIHGLGATRVKTTQDQIDTLDVSVTSGDHAVSLEPFMADRISVLKGSSTLLYGSGAIGGVVDVDTGRHKVEVPDAFSGRAEIRFADVDSSTTAAVRLDGRISDKLAWHVDAFQRDADDYDIPGFAESSYLRMAESHGEDHSDDHDEHHDDTEEHYEHEHEEAFGTLEGSFNESDGGAIALSFIGDRSHASVSVSRLNSMYGLVGHAHEHGHEEEHEEHDDREAHEDNEEHESHEEEGVGLIDLEQTRIDLRAGYTFDGAFVKKVDVLFGKNDYEHAEIEGSGEIGTLFQNDAWEARMEVQHQPVLGFKGIFGAQATDREFSAEGEEAFIEPVDTQSEALFWVGERETDSGAIEAGVRSESVDFSPTGGSMMPDRSFSSTSASIGYVFNQNETSKYSVLLDYSSRAPSIEELYSDGPHLATQTYDIGDPDLGEESAVSLSLTANWDWDALSVDSTVYYKSFSDFIYQAATGEEDDELPVFVYRQHDATFFGIDLNAEVELGMVFNGELAASLMFDMVDAELDIDRSQQNLPRIPSDRIGLGLSWENAVWTLRANYLHVDAQNSVADFELPTDGYEDLRVSILHRIEFGNSQAELFVRGRNLTNDEQRHHTSFVKDFAPAPGRTLEAGLRLIF